LAKLHLIRLIILVQISGRVVPYFCGGVPPVRSVLHFRPHAALSRFNLVFPLLVLQCAGFLQAQSSVGAMGQTAPPAVVSNVQESVGESNSTAPVADDRIARRDALLGLSAWDHTLEGAFELGRRLIQLSESAAVPVNANAILPARPFALRLSARGSHVSLASLVNAFRPDQLTRNGMNLDVNSAYGSFRLTYREIFTGRPNSLGGGFGQASAAATYSTPRFGSKGLMDFSAAALMGTGSVNTLLGGGFGNSLIGGNGPGRKPQNSPTVALKLTF
jgi:hypothetical protein